MTARWYRGRHRRDEKRVRRFATALLALVAVAGLATLVATTSGGRAGPAAVPTGATSAPAADQETTSAARACVTTVARAHDAVAAAQPSYTAVTAAKAVVDDWRAHVAMMKGKEHTDPTQYGRMWRDMVRAAPPNLDRFAQASLDLSDHTGCPRPA
jgi:hypothetical protein